MTMSHGATEQLLKDDEAEFHWTYRQCEQILKLHKLLKVRQRELGSRANLAPAILFNIAKAMTEVWSQRSRFRWGAHKMSDYQEKPTDSPVEEPLSTRAKVVELIAMVLLFSTHATYYERLEMARPEGHVYVPEFRRLLEGLLVEWADSNLLSTVVVLVDVGFLAVPNVNGFQVAAMLASILLALASVICGTYHTWQHRRNTDAEVEDAHKYVTRLREKLGPQLDLRIMACILCLPLAALMWSVVFFMIAISALAFQTSGMPAQAVMAAILGGAVVMVGVTVGRFWDSETEWWFRKKAVSSGASLRSEKTLLAKGLTSKLRSAAGGFRRGLLSCVTNKSK